MGAGTVRARARAWSDKKKLKQTKQSKTKQNNKTKQNQTKKNKRTMGAGCRYGKGKGSIVRHGLRLRPRAKRREALRACQLAWLAPKSFEIQLSDPGVSTF